MTQEFWSYVNENWPYGDRLLFVFWMTLGHSAITLPLNCAALLVHYFPTTLTSQYKIQQGADPSPRLVRSVILHVLFNHLVGSPLVSFFVLWPLFSYLEMPIHTPIPSIGRILGEWLVYTAINDCLFYWAHRAFHTWPWLYKNIHSQHHRFVTPISWAAEYAHPVEEIFANTIPVLTGAFLLRSHLFTLVAWLLIAITHTLDAHSGFKLPFSFWRLLDPVLLGPDGHDWHHSHNRGNYGLTKFWDYLCGSDKEYKKWLHERSSSTHKTD